MLPGLVLVAKLGLGDGVQVAGGRAVAVPPGHAVGATANPVDCVAKDPAVLGFPLLTTGEDGLPREAWTAA